MLVNLFERVMRDAYIRIVPFHQLIGFHTIPPCANHSTKHSLPNEMRIDCNFLVSEVGIWCVGDLGETSSLRGCGPCLSEPPNKRTFDLQKR